MSCTHSLFPFRSPDQRVSCIDCSPGPRCGEAEEAVPTVMWGGLGIWSQRMLRRTRRTRPKVGTVGFYHCCRWPRLRMRSQRRLRIHVCPSPQRPCSDPALLAPAPVLGVECRRLLHRLARARLFYSLFGCPYAGPPPAQPPHSAPHALPQGLHQGLMGPPRSRAQPAAPGSPSTRTAPHVYWGSSALAPTILAHPSPLRGRPATPAPTSTSRALYDDPSPGPLGLDTHPPLFLCFLLFCCSFTRVHTQRTT